jgi:hypothetical protein
MPHQGLDLPVVTQLSPAPATLVAGECGTIGISGGRYSYWLYKESTNTKFARFDHFANTWQNLEPPPTGAWAFGATNSIAYDEPNGWVWVYMTGVTGGTAVLLRFDVATLAWKTPNITTDVPVLTTATAMCVAGRKRAQWSGAQAVEGNGFVYLVGGGDQHIFRCNPAGGAVTQLAVRGALPGLGCGLVWAPDVDPDKLVSPQGGGSVANVDVYSIEDNTWNNAPVLKPAADIPAAGYAWAHCTLMPHTMFMRVAGGKVMRVDLASGTYDVSPACTLDVTETSPDQHGAFVATGVVEAPGTVHEFIFTQKFSGTEFRRVELVPE